MPIQELAADSSECAGSYIVDGVADGSWLRHLSLQGLTFPLYLNMVLVHGGKGWDTRRNRLEDRARIGVIELVEIVGL